MATKNSNATPTPMSQKSFLETLGFIRENGYAAISEINGELRSVPHYLQEQTPEGQVEKAQEIMQLKSLVSKYSAREFDKSAHWQLPFKFAGYAAKGAADFGVGIVDNIMTAGDDINAVVSYYSFKNATDSLADGDADKEQAAALVDKLVAAGYNRYDVANLRDIDGITDKKGKKLLDAPLSDKAKNIFRLYQKHLQAQETLERNRLIKDFYQEENDKSYWSSAGFGGFVFRGGNKKTKFAGELTGQAAASMATFGLVGSALPLAVAEATVAANLAKQGISLTSAAAKAAGVTRAGRALHKLGVANWVAKNYNTVQTFALATGKAGIFGISGQMAYKEARDLALSKGWTFEDANMIGVVSGMALGGVETFMNVKWTSRFIREKSPTFWNLIALGALPEGVQEASSEALSKAIYEVTGLQDEAFADIASDIIVSFVGGFIGGGVVGAFGLSGINEEAKVAGLKNYERAQRKAGTFDIVTRNDGAIAPYVMKGEVSNVREFGGHLDMEMNRIGMKTEQIGYEQPSLTKEDSVAQLEESQKEIGQEKTIIDAEFRKTKKLRELSDAERHIYEGMKDLYVERVKKNNPKVTEKQIENGWAIVENMMRHEKDTGEFTKTLEDNMNKVIAATDITDESVRERLAEAKKALGGLKDTDFDTDQVYYKLLSKDGRQKYDAEWELAMRHIEEEFAANGSRAQGKLYALLLKRRLYQLAAYFNGSPLELIELIKPTVINLSRARLNNQNIYAAHCVLDELLGKFENPSATLEETIDGKHKAVEVHNKIKQYRLIKDSKQKKALLKEISMDLFGYTDTLKTDQDLADLENMLETRAEQEFSIMDDMGIIDGNSMILNPEDFEIIALMREQGYTFSNIADAYGLNITDRAERDLDSDYNDSKTILYPPLTKDEIKTLNNLPLETRENIKFRDDPDFSRAEEEFYSEEEEEEISQDEIMQEQEAIDATEKKKKGKKRNEFALSGKAKKLVSTVEAVDSGQTQNGEPLVSSVKDNLYYRGTQGEGKSGSVEDFVTPNALYSREGRVIVVKNGVRQGELMHEAGHFLITEALLKADELAHILGVDYFGSLKEIYDILDEKIKLKGKRLTQIQKQETLLDAIARMAGEGSTGDVELDRLLNEVSAELAETIISPEGSVLEQMSSEELGSLGQAIKAFMGEGPIAVVKEMTSFEQQIRDMDTTNAIQKMEEIMSKYNLPGSEKYYRAFKKLTADGPENVSLYHLLLISDSFINFVKTFAGNKILEQENKQARRNNALAKARPKSKKTDMVYNDPEVYYFKAKGSKSNFFERPIKKDEGPLPFRSQKSYEEVFTEVPKNLKKMFAKGGQGTKLLFQSLVEIGTSVHPEVGSMISQRYWEKTQDLERWRQPAKKMSAIIDSHNEIVGKKDEKYFISKDDEKLLMRRLRDGKDVAKAFDVITKKMTPKEVESFSVAVADCISSLEEIKNTLTAYGALPVSGWRKNYWPFLVEGFDGLCEYFDAFPENPLAKIVAAERERAKKDGASKVQTEMRIIDAINGTAYGKNPEARVTAFHSRSSKLLDDGALEFYADPLTAYMKYIEDAATTIMNRKMFGNFNENTMLGGDFGKLVMRLGLAEKLNKISKKTPAELKRLTKREQNIYALNEAIKDYMSRTSTPEGWRKFNDVINISVLFNFASAIGQGFEHALNMFLYGPVSATKGLLKSFSGSSLQLADFNIDELNETFREISRGLIAEVSNYSSRLSLFRGFDRFMKKATLNTIWEYCGKTLATGKKGEYKYDTLMKRLDEAFAFAEGDPELAKGRKEQVIDDILNHRLTDDVKYFVMSLFQKQQPINSISIPSKYNSASPLARLCFYKLNTVQMTQMVRVFKDFNERWAHGKYKDVLAGFLGYIFYMLAVGVPLSVLQSFARFDKPSIKNAIIYAPLQTLGVNEYQVSLASEKGVGTAVGDRFSPPLTMLNDFFKPIIGTLKGKSWYEAGYEGWVKLAFAPTGFGAFAKGLYESVVDKPSSIPLDFYGAYEAALEPFDEALEGLSNYYM